ncbi:MAG: trypsin-like peptidase domain-containing protein [Fimbriimonadaceae bacterium]|nr:trypsin-like peptidase domain-containing protein [Fimbriimonadaceae bacterium]
MQFFLGIVGATVAAVFLRKYPQAEWIHVTLSIAILPLAYQLAFFARQFDSRMELPNHAGWRMRLLAIWLWALAIFISALVPSGLGLASVAVLTAFAAHLYVATDTPTWYSGLLVPLRRIHPAERLPHLAVVRVIAHDRNGIGAIVRPDGMVVTASHLVDGAKQVSIILANDEMLPATIVRVDRGRDLAFLKVERERPLPFARLDRRNRHLPGTPLTLLAMDSPSSAANTAYMPDGYVWATYREPVAVPTMLYGRALVRANDDVQLLGAAAHPLVRPGFSGAPAFGPDGRLVTLHFGTQRTGGLLSELPAQEILASAEEGEIELPRYRLQRYALPRESDRPEFQARQAAGEAWHAASFFLDRHPGLHPGDDPEYLARTEERFDKMIKASPHLGRLSTCRAAIRMMREDLDGAWSDLQWAFSQGSYASATWYVVEWALRTDRWADAEVLYKRALADMSEPGTVTNHIRSLLLRDLTYVLFRQEKYGECAAMALDGLEIEDHDRSTGRFFWIRGQALVRMERYEEAIEAYDEAISANEKEQESIDDWSGFVEALVGKGDPASLNRAVDLGLWHLRHRDYSPRAFMFAAEAASKLKRSRVSQWFEELSATYADDSEDDAP